MKSVVLKFCAVCMHATMHARRPSDQRVRQTRRSDCTVPRFSGSYPGVTVVSAMLIGVRVVEADIDFIGNSYNERDPPDDEPQITCRIRAESC